MLALRRVKGGGNAVPRRPASLLRRVAGAASGRLGNIDQRHIVRSGLPEEIETEIDVVVRSPFPSP